MAIKMAMIILAGAFGGKELDANIQFNFPVFTLILTLIGSALAIYIMIRDTSKK